MKNSAVLLIVCPDRTGLVATVAGLFYQHGANILHADQHQDPQAGLFFMRVEGRSRTSTRPLPRRFRARRDRSCDAVAHRDHDPSDADRRLRIPISPLPH